MVQEGFINNTFSKMEELLATHNSICVGVSGGSDSNIIVNMLAENFPQYLYKTHFEFNNTGLEYAATLRHIDYMRNRYGINIDTTRGESVVSVVQREGVPIVSKEFSTMVDGVQRGVPSYIRKFKKERSESKYALTPKLKSLAEYLIENKVKISSKCCDLSKKNPSRQYLRAKGCDLFITGERQREGGLRSSMHSSCFEPARKKKKYDHFMPLFFWNDETKQFYKETEDITYSDCYEIWGMTRTGCVGCPFNSNVGNDLKAIKKYEPKLYKACLNVFGESYSMMDRFNIRRVPIFDSIKSYGQN